MAPVSVALDFNSEMPISRTVQYKKVNSTISFVSSASCAHQRNSNFDDLTQMTNRLLPLFVSRLRNLCLNVNAVLASTGAWTSSKI